jgi:hypothetical protein
LLRTRAGGSVKHLNDHDSFTTSSSGSGSGSGGSGDSGGRFHTVGRHHRRGAQDVAVRAGRAPKNPEDWGDDYDKIREELMSRDGG